MTDVNASRVNCIKCRFYYVTWEKKHPHGCRRMNFKSREVPSLVVRKSSSGMDCLLFEPKPDQNTL
jgi:hypothetical protein